MADQKPIFIRPNQAKALFSISRSTLYRWADAGRIKIHKRGGLALVRVEDLENEILGVGDQMGDRNPKA